MKNRKNLLEGPIFGSIIKLAIPIMIANVLQAAYQLVDAFWVGRLGGNAVAAVSVATPVIFLTMALGLGLAIAGSILIAQYFGAGNKKMVNHATAQTLLMVIVVSVSLAIAGYLLTPFFLRALKVAPNVYQGALGFMQISFIGMVFNFNFMVFQGVMRGVGRATLPVFIVLGTVILNFALDPIFIFGWHFVPALGVKGAAMATVGTQSIALIIGYIILFRGRHDIHLHFSDFVPDTAFIKRAFKIGFPSSIEQSMRGVGLIAMTFLVVRFGTDVVAGYGAGSNIIQFVMIPALGLSMAISTLVGQNIGAGNITRATNIARLGAISGFVILAVLSIPAFLFSSQIISFFVPQDPNVVQYGATYLRIASLSWGFLGLQLCLVGTLRASGNTVIPMLLALVSQWGLQFPLALLLSHFTKMAEKGIWVAIPVSTIITALITLVIFAKGNWRNKKIIDTNTELTKKVEDEIISEGAEIAKQ